MYRVLFFVILIPPLSLYSSDLDELITYGSSTKNHLLYSRRCSALNFYFASYIPDFDQKSEEYGYFFDKIAFGFSALNYYDDREDYKNSDEIQKKKLGEKIITENDEYNEKYRLATNVGYGSKHHLDGIKQYGITEFHRKTFGICKKYN